MVCYLLSGLPIKAHRGYLQFCNSQRIGACAFLRPSEGALGPDKSPKTLYWGLPHPRTTVILRTLATRLARRRGCSVAEWGYRRLRAAVGVEIWRRAARQVMACWPACEEDDD